MPIHRRKSGLTLIELLVVIALIAILAASVSPFLSQFLLRTHTDTMVDKVISTLRKAQEYSMDGKNDASWGVCVTGSNLRMYRGGTCGSPTASEDFVIPSTVTVTGLSGVTFSKLRGEPSATTTATITSAIESHTVVVNIGGGMTIN